MGTSPVMKLQNNTQCNTCQVSKKVVEVHRRNDYIKIFVLICMTSPLPWQQNVSLLLLMSKCNTDRKSGIRYLEIKLIKNMNVLLLKVHDLLHYTFNSPLRENVHKW